MPGTDVARTRLIAEFLHVGIGDMRVGYGCCQVQMGLFLDNRQMTAGRLPTRVSGRQRGDGWMICLRTRGWLL